MPGKVYRFKFSPSVTELMTDFSKLHLFDEKDALIETFEAFWRDNLDVLEEEETRLKSIGFTDDFKRNVYRSIKYYHIKKLKHGNHAAPSSKEDEPSKTIINRTFTKSIIQLIDDKIKTAMQEQESEFKPSKYFKSLVEDDDMKNALMLYYREVSTTSDTNSKSEDTAESRHDNDSKEQFNKLKKLYQNRYYIISKNI